MVISRRAWRGLGGQLVLLSGLALAATLSRAVADDGQAAGAEQAEVADGSEPDVSAAWAEIEAAGGKVRQLAQNVDWLEVSLARSSQPVTADALAAVARLPQVRWLYLQGTDITDEGLQQVGKLSALTRLHLERTEVSDTGLAALAGLANLEYLNLYGTRVTDRGLASLQGLQKLRQVYLWQTEVTPQGVQALQASLPQAVIVTAVPLPAPPRPPLATAQFVRVRLLGEDKILSLAEVEVFSAGDDAPLHSTGTASQSSVAYEGEPGRALDGRTDATYDSGSITHTATEAYPWWQLDLGAAKAVGRIKVWNRGEQTGTRLEGALVELLDAQRQVVWSATITGAADGSTHEFTPPSGVSAEAPPAAG